MRDEKKPARAPKKKTRRKKRRAAPSASRPAHEEPSASALAEQKTSTPAEPARAPARGDDAPALSTRAMRLLALMFKTARVGELLWSTPPKRPGDADQQWRKTAHGVEVTGSSPGAEARTLSKRAAVIELASVVAGVSHLEPYEVLWLGRALVAGIDVAQELGARAPSLRARAALSALGQLEPVTGSEQRNAIDAIVLRCRSLRTAPAQSARSTPTQGAPLGTALAAPLRRARRAPRAQARALRALLEALDATHADWLERSRLATLERRPEEAALFSHRARELESASPHAAALVDAFCLPSHVDDDGGREPKARSTR